MIREPVRWRIGSGVLTFQSNHCIADSVGLVLVSGSMISLDLPGLRRNRLLKVSGAATAGYMEVHGRRPHVLLEFGSGLGTVEQAPSPL